MLLTNYELLREGDFALFSFSSPRVGCVASTSRPGSVSLPRLSGLGVSRGHFGTGKLYLRPKRFCTDPFGVRGGRLTPIETGPRGGREPSRAAPAAVDHCKPEIPISPFYTDLKYPLKYYMVVFCPSVASLNQTQMY